GPLWGTVRDLCRWAWFLAEPDESVLKRESVEEMRTVQSIDDHVRWTGGYGLGLMLRRDGGRILVAHGGSMPGFIAGVYVSPADKIGAATLTNSSSAMLGDVTLKLVAATHERWPVPPEPWRVEEPPPDDVLPLLGIWFMEGEQFVLSWRKGTLEARFPDDPEWKPPAVFRRESADQWRVFSGWEVMMLSWRIMLRTCLRVMPTARSMPISRVRSNTVSTSVFTIPKRLMTIDSESRT